jgi:hypothetical protein
MPWRGRGGCSSAASASASRCARRSPTAGSLTDPRVEVVTTDVIDLLLRDRSTYDAVCLDIDNGPAWTVTESNALLYSDEGTALLVSQLGSGGVLSVWGAGPCPAYDVVLGRHLDDVRLLTTEVARGEPDVVWVGRRPQG